MTDCLFCKIIAKQIPADIVFEDDHAVAFRDISPKAPTHVLVIPRTHIPTIDDISADQRVEIGHLFRVAAQVAKQDKLSSGYRTVVNCGAHAGQSVFHVHLHLLGGRPMGWPPFPGT